MMKRIGLLVVIGLGALSVAAACDDNPLAKDRDKVDRLFLNPSFVNVLVGDSTFVTANAINIHNEPTGDSVAGEACDGKVTVKLDPERTAFELPERFIVRGVTAGESCLNVTSGGKSASVTINVVEPE